MGRCELGRLTRRGRTDALGKHRGAEEAQDDEEIFDGVFGAQHHEYELYMDLTPEIGYRRGYAPGDRWRGSTAERCQVEQRQDSGRWHVAIELYPTFVGRISGIRIIEPWYANIVARLHRNGYQRGRNIWCHGRSVKLQGDGDE